MKKVVLTRDTSKDVYRCDPYRWIYYPERGDPTQNIPPGTSFSDLPDTWRCPSCKEPKRVFVWIERDQECTDNIGSYGIRVIHPDNLRLY